MNRICTFQPRYRWYRMKFQFWKTKQVFLAYLMRDVSIIGTRRIDIYHYPRSVNVRFGEFLLSISTARAIAGRKWETKLPLIVRIRPKWWFLAEKWSFLPFFDQKKGSFFSKKWTFLLFSKKMTVSLRCFLKFHLLFGEFVNFEVYEKFPYMNPNIYGRA